jgi:inhibitor of KinA
VIPVCYDHEFSPDLKEVSAQTGRSVEEIIDAHLNTEFYVYMLGFMPGFAYMGDMPDEFSCRRKETPRTKVPLGAVGLALRQTAIYPFESPGGWQIIGRTPMKMFDPTREHASLLNAGDTVRFRKISLDEFRDYQLS